MLDELFEAAIDVVGIGLENSVPGGIGASRQTQDISETGTGKWHQFPAPVLLLETQTGESRREHLRQVAGPGENPIAAAFRRAWKNFVGVVAASIAALGVLIPLAVVALLCWVAYRRWIRKAR